MRMKTMTINPIGKMSRKIEVEFRPDKIMIEVGCFRGTTAEFRERINHTYRRFSKWDSEARFFQDGTSDWRPMDAKEFAQFREEYRATAEYLATLEKIWCKKPKKKKAKS